MGPRELHPHLNGQPRKRLSEPREQRVHPLELARLRAPSCCCAGRCGRSPRPRARPRRDRPRRAWSASSRALRACCSASLHRSRAWASSESSASASDSISGASSVAARSAAALERALGRAHVSAQELRDAGKQQRARVHRRVPGERGCRSLRIVGHPPDPVPAQRCPQQQVPQLRRPAAAGQRLVRLRSLGRQRPAVDLAHVAEQSVSERPCDRCRLVTTQQALVTEVLQARLDSGEEAAAEARRGRAARAAGPPRRVRRSPAGSGSPQAGRRPARTTRRRGGCRRRTPPAPRA